jgi:hypothetical protein
MYISPALPNLAKRTNTDETTPHKYHLDLPQIQEERRKIMNNSCCMHFNILLNFLGKRGGARALLIY